MPVVGAGRQFGRARGDKDRARSRGGGYSRRLACHFGETSMESDSDAQWLFAIQVQKELSIRVVSGPLE